MVKKSASSVMEISELILTDALLLAYHHNNLYLHELALHEDHPPEDFLPPFTIDHILLPDPERKITSSYVDAISVCISSAHSLIELMLSMSVEALRALPVFNFVRMAYACTVLTKLYVSVLCPTSQIGKVLDRETLRIGIYVPAMIDRLNEAVGRMECRSPATFLGLLVRLRAWYENQEMHEEFTGPLELCGPDRFTLPVTNDPQSAKDSERTSGLSVSELAQIRVLHGFIAPLRGKFGQMDPFRDFLTGETEHLDGLPSSSSQSSGQVGEMEPVDDFLFDPTQIDFDMDPYLMPEGMEFLDAGISGWSTTMDPSGDVGALKALETVHGSSNG
jgi:hypothetical protein